jgi:hypothetical protein
MRKSRLAPAILIAAAGALMAAGMPATASPRPAVPATASWQVNETISSNNYPMVTAITASSPTSAWAFETGTGQSPDVFRLTGTTWSQRPSIGTVGATVVSATSDASGNSWAFMSKKQAWWFNGTVWAKVKTFAKAIGSGVAVGSDDVWVFGELYAPGSGLGAWHYNGSTQSWKQYRSGRGLLGGSALSPSNIWAYGAKSVAHFNGSSWKSRSVASLLPRRTELCNPHLSGIDALSSRNVFVTATGGCQDVGGPLVLLHYNGSQWKRLSIPKNLGAPVAVVSDGSGGVWIPVMTGFPGFGTMEHYSDGHLHSATMPIAKKHLALFAASTAPGSTAAFAAGYYRPSLSNPSSFTGEILEYGP